MSHSHDHPPANSLSTAFWLNTAFTFIELAGGIYTNSTAILTDAIHDFGDSLAIGGGILLEKLAGRKRTERFTYGYRRFSLLSAVLLSLFLLGGAFAMLVNSVNALFEPKEVNSTGMLWLAVLGVLVNGIAFIRLYKSEQDHHHHNSRAIMLHFLEDVLGWVAVLIGAVIIYFTGWNWIDPVLSILISVFIMSRAVPNLVSTFKVLLQVVPGNVDTAKLSAEILQIGGVSSIHDLHVWTLEGEYNVLTLHVVLENEEPVAFQPIREQIEQLLQRYHIEHPTLQLELKGESCSLRTC